MAGRLWLETSPFRTTPAHGRRLRSLWEITLSCRTPLAPSGRSLSVSTIYVQVSHKQCASWRLALAACVIVAAFQKKNCEFRLLRIWFSSLLTGGREPASGNSGISMASHRCACPSWQECLNMLRFRLAPNFRRVYPGTPSKQGSVAPELVSALQRVCTPTTSLLGTL